MDMIMYFVSSTIAATAYALLCNIPKRTIVASGFAGGVAGIVFYFLSTIFSLGLFFAAGVAAFAVAFLSQWYARFYRMPVIVFAIPGVLPLVPGGSAYNMMRAFVEGNPDLAMFFATETFLVSGAIALGLSVNSALFQIFSTKMIPKDKTYLP